MSYFPNSVEVDKFKNYNREKKFKKNNDYCSTLLTEEKGYDILLNIGQKL